MERLNICFTSEQIKELRKEAQITSLSLSEIVRQAIEKHLKQSVEARMENRNKRLILGESLGS